VKLDFQPPKNTHGTPRRSRRRAPLFLALLAAAVLFGLLAHQQPVATTEARTESSVKEPPPPAVPEIRREVVRGTVHPGDTITALLGDYFTPQEILGLNRKSKKIFPLSGICAGQPFKLCLVEGNFDRFEYDINRNDQLIISRGEEGFDISRVPIAYRVETELVRGTISTNLFDAVARSGESAELALALADIFAWDIDFILDIRQGDSFQTLVEKRFREGQPAGYGRILAAEFNNQGQNYKALLYQNGDRSDYYDAKGNSLRKAFLRAPLAFTRISSGFTMRRFHPITKTWKAHPAIDYAAPRGTPIKTVGDGTIIRIGRTKYNGNHIKIRHNSTYQTLYLHMSRFAKGMHKGKKVRQGQVIGYVGSTGLATGPHLCFRMYKNGSPVNPNRVKVAAVPPIPAAKMAEFKAAVAPLLARLEGQELHQASLAATPEKTPVR